MSVSIAKRGAKVCCLSILRGFRAHTTGDKGFAREILNRKPRFSVQEAYGTVLAESSEADRIRANMCNANSKELEFSTTTVQYEDVI